MFSADVVIIGGGFGGLYSGEQLSSMGYKVVVVEQSSVVGYPPRSGGGTWFNEMVELGVPKEFLHPIDYLDIYLLNDRIARFEAVRDRGAVLHTTRYLQYLAEKASDNGALILVGEKIQEIKYDKEYAVLYSDKREFRARAVIDASGAWGFIAHKMGLIKEWKRYGVGLEYEVYAGKTYSNAVIILGDEYAVAGYAWIFPIDRRVRVGVGTIRPYSNIDPGNYIERVINLAKSIGFDLKSTIEIHRGVFPAQEPLNKLVVNNTVIVGDAGSLGSPLLGEGIRFALMTSKNACRFVSLYLDTGDHEKLKGYEEWFKKELYKDHMLALKVQELAALSSNEELKRYVLKVVSIYKKKPELIELFLKSKLEEFLSNVRVEDLV